MPLRLTKGLILALGRIILFRATGILIVVIGNKLDEVQVFYR